MPENDNPGFVPAVDHHHLAMWTTAFEDESVGEDNAALLTLMEDNGRRYSPESEAVERVAYALTPPEEEEEE